MQFGALLAAVALAYIASPQSGVCERLLMPSGVDSVVGELRVVRAREDETLVDIAREFNLGYDQIVKANPTVNRWIPGDGTEVVLPHRYILPSAVHRGVVLNISELRLYYYPASPKGAAREVLTYPVSIGRMDWMTPLGETKVVKKERDPAWRPPASIREEHARDGDPLPEVIPGGHPENPLGRFALRLGIPSYLIHGVDERKAFGIGMRVTHGCIRMYPEDIESLFDIVPVGTQVLIVDEPIKIGRMGDKVFLSVYQPLDDGENEDAPPPPRVSVDDVINHLRKQIGLDGDVDIGAVSRITEEGDGLPHEIALVSGVPASDRAIGGSPAAGPAQSGRSVNDEYEEAMSRYLGRPVGEATPKLPQVERRHVPAPELYGDDEEVRRYLEERY